MKPGAYPTAHMHPPNENECIQTKNNYTVQNIEINMATHNINGLKTHGYRLDILIQWAKENNLNLISISETNIQEIEGNYLLKEEVDYRGIWTNASSSKHKGSGVGLLVQKDLEKYIGKIERPNKFLLVVHFFLKHNSFIVISVYLLLNNKEVAKSIKENIKKIKEEHQRSKQIIVMGDFNSTIDPNL